MQLQQLLVHGRQFLSPNGAFNVLLEARCVSERQRERHVLVGQRARRFRKTYDTTLDAGSGHHIGRGRACRSDGAAALELGVRVGELGLQVRPFALELRGASVRLGQGNSEVFFECRESLNGLFDLFLCTASPRFFTASSSFAIFDRYADRSCGAMGSGGAQY
jgi:hypothetical protein